MVVLAYRSLIFFRELFMLVEQGHGVGMRHKVGNEKIIAMNQRILRSEFMRGFVIHQRFDNLALLVQDARQIIKCRCNLIWRIQLGRLAKAFLRLLKHVQV